MAKQKIKRATVTMDQLMTLSRTMAQAILADKDTTTALTIQRIVTTILSRFQGFWNMQKAVEHRGDPQLYMNFISEDFVVKKKKESGYNEGDVVFKLHLSDIEDDNHYDRARAALNLIPFIAVLVPDKKNPDYWRTQSFADIRGRTEEDPITRERYFIGTEFEVIMPRLVAENYLDISLQKGWIRLMSYPMYKLRCAPSIDLYGFLSEKWNMGHAGDVITVTIIELRTRLGFVKTKNEDRSGMYLAWSKFCEKVLEPAKREMGNLAATGGMPFTFTYEPLLYGQPLPPYKRPDAVRFVLTRTDSGRRLIDRSDYNAQSIAAKNFMKDKFLLTDKQARGLMKRITPDILPGLLDMMDNLLREITDGIRQANSIPATAYYEIDRYIRTNSQPFFTPAEEISEACQPVPPAVPVSAQPSLGSAPGGSPAREAACPSLPPTGVLPPTGGVREGLLVGPDARAIYLAVTALQQQLTPEDYERWAQPVISQQTPLSGHTLTVRYYGPYYRQKHARQQPAFLAVLAAIRAATDGRIQDITALHSDSGQEREL